MDKIRQRGFEANTQQSVVSHANVCQYGCGKLTGGVCGQDALKKNLIG